MGKLILVLGVVAVVAGALVVFGSPAPRPVYYWRE
jgi:hypothetical protein